MCNLLHRPNQTFFDLVRVTRFLYSNVNEFGSHQNVKLWFSCIEGGVYAYVYMSVHNSSIGTAAHCCTLSNRAFRSSSRTTSKPSLGVFRSRIGICCVSRGNCSDASLSYLGCTLFLHALDTRAG